MQVVRNTYKSRRIAYDDDAYNLPLDTIYFIESKWNYHLNEYVYSHKQEIEQLLQKDFGGFFPYKFEIVSLSNLQNPLLQNAISELHPEYEQKIDFSLLVDKNTSDKEPLYQSTMLQRLMTKQPSFEETFTARLIPSEYNDTYDFYAIDISLCSETLLLEILKKYVHDLNNANLTIFGKQKFWRDYNTHDEVLPVGSNLSFGGKGISFCGNISAKDNIPSPVESEIQKLNITPDLKELVLKLKDNVDSYQRANGINVLLENKFTEFVKSFEKFEVKPLSALEINNTYHIYLTDYEKEVKMYTMPKTIYFFFLRHPQGIYLKDIIDYRQELLHIYRLLTRQDYSLEEAQAKIDGLLDLTNGYLNQYMSRISEAFRNVLSTELAKNYAIAGKRNELRRITLDTTKVILPEKLKF